MTEWLDNQKQSISNFRQLLQEQIEKVDPRSELTAEETKRLAKLEAIADKPKRTKIVQSGKRLTHLLHTYYLYNLSY